jgi:hypothetical protein
MRRALAVALLLVVAASVWALIVEPVRALYESQHLWRQNARELLAYSKGSVVTLQQLETQVSAMRASSLWSKLYRSDQASAGASILQSDVGTMLTGVQAGAQSLTPIRSSSAGALLQVGVHVTAAMRIDQLQQFVSAVRAHPKYLRMEQLTIAAPQSQGATENPVLTVNMDIHGFELMQKPGSASPTRARR